MWPDYFLPVNCEIYQTAWIHVAKMLGRGTKMVKKTHMLLRLNSFPLQRSAICYLLWKVDIKWIIVFSESAEIITKLQSKSCSGKITNWLWRHFPTNSVISNEKTQKGGRNFDLMLSFLPPELMKLAVNEYDYH